MLTDSVLRPEEPQVEVDNMGTQPRRYWAIRTDKENVPLLLGELRSGRLRQGWGYHPAQDLRLVQAEITQGGKWWERLTEEQKEILGHLKMLSATEGGVQRGDWILVPNLPEYGPFFLVAEVVGEYYYEMLPLGGETNEVPLRHDYGHVLPVRLITERGINRYAEIVDAGIRNTLKTPMRMWNVDGYRDAIEQLITRYNAGGEFSTATSGTARMQTAWEIALSHAARLLQERLGSELDARFQAAEWEEPITVVLKILYPGADVRWVAGRQEYGADVVVQLMNHFGGLPWLIVIQVKNYTGEIGPAVLEQLKTAHARYSTEGQILSLVVMTTAERMSADLAPRARRLETELTTPVKFVLRNEMMRILSNGLMAKISDGKEIIEQPQIDAERRFAGA